MAGYIKPKKLSETKGYKGCSTKRCQSCYHWDRSARCCMYNINMGVSRGCPPGPECIQYKKGIRKVKSIAI